MFYFNCYSFKIDRIENAFFPRKKKKKRRISILTFIELCNYLGFVLRLTAGRIIAKSSGGGGTKWPPISPNCPTWCRHVQPWPGNRTNWPYSGWRSPIWETSEVSTSSIQERELANFLFPTNCSSTNLNFPPKSRGSNRRY